MRAATRSVTYVVYSDEGRGLAPPENRLDFAARTEQFFSTCLGLKKESTAVPTGSSAVVR